MPLELRHVVSAAEIAEFIKCYCESFAEPDSAFTYLAAPKYGTDQKAHDDRVLDFSARQWFAHCLDPSSHLIKIIDTELDGKVLAGAKWHVHLTDPFNDREVTKASAFWWPPGTSQQYTEAVLDTLNELRTFTHPEHRRRGAGRLLMERATQKADEHNLEIFIEASPLGSALYTGYGLRILGIVELNPPPGSPEQEANDEWKAWRALTQNLRCAVLKRPVHGIWRSQEPCGLGEAGGSLDTNTWDKPTHVD